MTTLYSFLVKLYNVFCNDAPQGAPLFNPKETMSLFVQKDLGDMIKSAAGERFPGDGYDFATSGMIVCIFNNDRNITAIISAARRSASDGSMTF